ncbi:MAG TPA: hypothetical protein ENN77_02820 [Candidatus Wirthbacteria bacterium]|nr:hypothetical protein [Candidatus Wirthbacteria bacterium]
MKKPIKLPKFASEDEEREYWDKIDLSEHLEARDMQSVHFPDLKPTTRSISIRLPEYMLVRLKERANALSIPYQSLIKTYLQDSLNK